MGPQSYTRNSVDTSYKEFGLEISRNSVESRRLFIFPEDSLRSQQTSYFMASADYYSYFIVSADSPLWSQQTRYGLRSFDSSRRQESSCIFARFSPRLLVHLAVIYHNHRTTLSVRFACSLTAACRRRLGKGGTTVSWAGRR